MTFTNIACDILPRRAPYAAKSIRLNIFAFLPSPSLPLSPFHWIQESKHDTLRCVSSADGGYIDSGGPWTNSSRPPLERRPRHYSLGWMDRAVRFVPTDRLLRGLGRWNNLKSYVASSMNRFEPRKNGESVLDLVSSFFSFPSPLPQHRGERGCRSKTSFASAFRWVARVRE